MKELENSKRIIPYNANGEQYFIIPKFLDHQNINRPSQVRNPSPPEFLTLTEGSLSTHHTLTEGSLSTHHTLTEGSVSTHRTLTDESESESESETESSSESVNDDDILNFVKKNWQKYLGKQCPNIPMDDIKKYNRDLIIEALQRMKKHNGKSLSYFRNVLNTLEFEKKGDDQAPDHERAIPIFYQYLDSLPSETTFGQALKGFNKSKFYNYVLDYLKENKMFTDEILGNTKDGIRRLLPGQN